MNWPLDSSLWWGQPVFSILSLKRCCQAEGSELQSFLYRVCEWLRAASPAPLVTIEIAIVGLIVSGLQMRYMKRRDKVIDIRNAWTDMHKLMLTFRFKRMLLNQSDGTYPGIAQTLIAVSESLHNLRGQLDRMPDCRLVEQLTDFIDANQDPEKWRAEIFEKQFDAYAHEAALLTRPVINK